MSNTLTIGSLFSGCGGLDLGFVKEGFVVVWANDNDKDACATYRKNIGNIIESNIEDVNIETLTQPDVLVGGLPCQDFSMLMRDLPDNKVGLNTQRGNLYLYMCYCIKLLKPKLFLMENVPGLLSVNNGLCWKKILNDFNSCGYNINYKVVNFAGYGAPQLRKRIIVVGIREDLKSSFVFPIYPYKKETQYVSSEEALKNISKDSFNNELFPLSKKEMEFLQFIPEGGNYFDLDKKYQPYEFHLTRSLLWRRLNRNKPSLTIVGAGQGGTLGYHFQENRALTNRERARLQTFPDDFVFIGNIHSVRKQIGNAIPPESIRPIAKQIKNTLLNKLTNCQNVLV